MRQKLYRIENDSVITYKVVKKIIQGVKNQNKYCLFDLNANKLCCYFEAESLEKLSHSLNNFFVSKEEAKKQLNKEKNEQKLLIKHFKTNSKGERQTFKLKEIIAKLELLPSDAKVKFDFLDYAPCDFNSWRGDYFQLALSYEKVGIKKVSGTVKFPLVSEFLEQCKGVMNATFEGWKGGDYKMHEDCEVWIDNAGESWGLPILDIVLEGEFAIIKTTKNKI